MKTPPKKPLIPAAEAPAKPEYPMRINKYLAMKGHSTRKGADDLIKKRAVTINGRRAVLGDKVEASDSIQVMSTKKPVRYEYYALNKPRGVVTHSPQKGEKDISAIANRADLFPVGRLDKESDGLIILTNDGRITDRLLNPKYEHEKEYDVTTKMKLRNNFKERMEGGVNIEGEMTKPCKVRIEGEQAFTVTLSEGKRHQIRRMCSALFNEVKNLRRTRIMNIELGGLAAGHMRMIKGEELQVFLKSLGL